ncbi:hypothetical protein CQW23_13593 [Capsicum baccatum]|uniref:Rab-GAP TBC domain-containing protein n=1 Tax=Capsicum baccatum TaxID=33114 RepID=A0A2G2WGR3_CAPBA|nr:hypothetical protein CQW23_13593 [Capsicum baccatum]
MGNSILAACKNGNSSLEELQSYFPVRPECQADVPNTRFRPRAGKTLSERRWKAAFSQEGYLDIAGVLRRIQRGGIHLSIKGAVWEFLLGCFDPNSTFEERNELRQRRREQYAAWKSECQMIVPVIGSGKFTTNAIVTDDGQPIELANTTSDAQDTNNAMPVENGVYDKKVVQWKLNLPQIGLDVVRTDRSLVFYENQANQAKLWDVLAVYAWMDKDIGYVQGMTDICSPMVILLENEADAFWCFERAMRRLRENFKSSANSIGVQSQLGTLAQIVKIVDPKLHQHIEELDGGEYLFALRMLMVLFRREVSFVDALYLWEVMWAMEYNPNIYSLYDKTMKQLPDKLNDTQLKQYGKYERRIVRTGATKHDDALAVFLVASVLETKKKRLMKEAKGLDDVVQILDEITGNLDAKKALKEALKLTEDMTLDRKNMEEIKTCRRLIGRNDDKKKDMQIGFPTDVQHVAHIGWDGKSVDNPSWMKEYKSPGAFQSAPLALSPRELKETPDIKWVSEDSNRRSRNAANSSPTKEKPDKPRTSRRHSTTENVSNENTTNKEPGTKSRSSRRHHHKDTSDGHKSSESVGKNNHDIPKKSRRKKSKEDGGSNRSSRSKDTCSSTTQTTESGPGQESHESSGICKEIQEE